MHDYLSDLVIHPYVKYVVCYKNGDPEMLYANEEHIDFKRPDTLDKPKIDVNMKNILLEGYISLEDNAGKHNKNLYLGLFKDRNYSLLSDTIRKILFSNTIIISLIILLINWIVHHKMYKPLIEINEFVDDLVIGEVLKDLKIDSLEMQDIVKSLYEIRRQLQDIKNTTGTVYKEGERQLNKMRVVSIDKIKPGMIIGKNIYSADGRILLKENVLITEGYLVQLNRLGISYIYIKDGVDDDIVVDDVIREESRVEAVNITRQAIEKIHKGQSFDASKVKTTINKIVDELLNNSNLVLNLIDIRAQGDYLYGHSVNVAVLSGIIGVALNYNEIMLRDLMLGALFHDIGKTKLDREVTGDKNLVDSLRDAESKKHCQHGFDILRANTDISLYSAHVAYQHHEYFNGNGYPRGLKGQEISEFARIVSIANTYDIFLSNVGENEETSILKAVEYLTANCGTIFDPELVAIFLKRVAIYPMGTRVTLNTGEKGVVIKTHKNFPTQPVVRIDTNLFGVEFGNSYDVDLSSRSAYFIISHEGNL